ncbi:hypothetical protein AUR64_00545 [Haloprofundus marisrubri]|uniref:HVO-0234-like beta-propeller domain-containing protein n=1 Tax=Haloprofundus marisrubri TaxID=1514971 RepID=A0A0W1R481_9EURY|nr:hypothetical protein [Haloprofundus marisrubri]KTG08101.1 hypothetical protein AUR64_00545 [Haloprofundus marisrubri]
MPTIDEKRVYADKTGKAELFVAAALGVVVVDVSDDRIGGFGIDHRCTALDVASAAGHIAVATDERVLLDRGEGEGFENAGFGSAVAVGFDGDDLLAADESGRVARRAIDAADTDENSDAWTTLGEVDHPRAIDGSLVAAADGVHRVDGDALSHVGLDDARDVSASGVPLAATGSGLYALGNGWMDVLSGSFRVVASDGRRAHAVGDGRVYARTDDDEWETLDVPVDEPLVGVVHGPATYAVTEAGTLLMDAGDGWRSQTLGLDGIAGVGVRFIEE